MSIPQTAEEATGVSNEVLMGPHLPPPYDPLFYSHFRFLLCLC